MRSITLDAISGVRRRSQSGHSLLYWGLAWLHEWRRRSRSRAELARLDLRMLRDIGITPADAWCESNKPFWRK